MPRSKKPVENKTIEEYHEWCYLNWNGDNKVPEYTLRDDYIMGMGFNGETGEVTELLKKSVRDGNLDIKDLILELGDVLYYWNIILHRHGITPAQVMASNIKKLEARRAKRRKHK